MPKPISSSKKLSEVSQKLGSVQKVAKRLPSAGFVIFNPKAERH